MVIEPTLVKDPTSPLRLHKIDNALKDTSSFLFCAIKPIGDVGIVPLQCKLFSPE